MPETRNEEAAQVQPKHASEDALRELEALAADWVERQRRRLHVIDG